ncbi:unnamed protein product [Closterium sp. NIES-65]|nr:unnamed protein product [Closterium sp. NIES-65]
MGCAASHARGSETPPPPQLGSSRSGDACWRLAAVADPRSPYRVRKSAEAGGGVCEYSYQEVHAATGGFQHEVGRGGFGVVYHGYLAEPHGGQGAGVWAVAVKLMSGEHIANGIDSFMVRHVGRGGRGWMKEEGEEWWKRVRVIVGNKGG